MVGLEGGDGDLLGGICDCARACAGEGQRETRGLG